MKNVLLATVTAALLTASLPAAEGKIQQRKENQQARIAQGVQTGQLTPKETAKLENREANLNREVHNDRVANGGKLTAAEKKHINRQQNHISKAIYNQKHDTQVQPK